MENHSTFTIDKFIKIIKAVTPSFSENELNLPLRNTPIDSLDLVIIRVEMEKIFGSSISDIKWYGFNSVKEIYEYFKNLNLTSRGTEQISVESRLSRNLSINMPQMANSALSENWLLKELGDIHWELLTNGLKVQSSKIIDEQGDRLYATFTRIKFKCIPLYLFNENDMIEFTGQINRYGNNTFLSQVTSGSTPISLSATLMTNFTKRNNQQNNFLQKSTPKINEISIPEIKYLPSYLNEYRLLTKNLAESYSLFGEEFNLARDSVYEKSYNLNPF